MSGETHPGFEALTGSAGAIGVLRFTAWPLYDALRARHLRVARMQNGLAYGRFETAEGSEDVLLVEAGGYPEIHFHGGAYNLGRWLRLTEELACELGDFPAPPGEVADLLRLWEETFATARGTKALAYLLDLRTHGLDESLKKSRTGRLHGCEYIQPLKAAIAGPANSGKSTLFNRILGETRALVSPHPGTTRDILRGEIEIAGFALDLSDGAGIGLGPGGALRAEGLSGTLGDQALDLARTALVQADIVLLFDLDLPPALAAGKAILPLASKADLGQAIPAGRLGISGLTGQGIEKLLEWLAATAQKLRPEPPSAVFHPELLCR